MKILVSPGSEPNPLRRYPRRPPPRDRAVLALAVAAAGAVCAAVGMARGLTGGSTAGRGPQLLALVAGAVLCGVGLFLFQRGLRRQARLRAIADLMPHYRAQMGYARASAAVAASSRRASALDDWEQEAADWAADERADRPLARAEMRAATRALLVSLEDELRHEAALRHQRSARPACRRARLRAAGRGPLGQRRRIAVRPVRDPS